MPGDTSLNNSLPNDMRRGTARPLSGSSSGSAEGFNIGNNNSKIGGQDGASTNTLDAYKKKSRWAHRLLWFAVILLLLLIGRSFLESIMLRKNNNDLRAAVDSQTLAISQAGSVAPSLGAGLAPSGTTLTGPDGQVYICPAGTAGSSGTTGQTGAVGSAGAAGGPGFSVVAGNGLSDVDPSANVVLDINNGGGLALSSDTLQVLGADGTILVSGSGVKVGLINDTNLNSGFGLGQVSAEDILLQDLGGYYLSGNVEDALQEAGPVVAAGLQSLDGAYNNYGAVVGPTITVDGAQGQSGNLVFDLTTTQDLAIQDAGINFAIFDDTGNVTFFNDFGVGAVAGAETLSNVGFLPNGDDAYIADSLGVEGAIYSDSGLTIGSLSEAPTTTYGKGSVASAGVLDLSSAAASDISLLAAGDINLTPSGSNVFVTGGLSVAQSSLADAVSITQSTANDGLYIHKTAGSGAGQGLLIENEGTKRGLFVISGSTGYAGLEADSAAEISQRNSTGVALMVNSVSSSDTLVVKDADNTLDHYGLSIDYSRDSFVSGASAALHVLSSPDLITGTGDGIMQIDANAPQTETYNFIELRSDANGTPDVEFKVDSAGTVYGDGGVYTTPADYAEYFNTKNLSLVPGEIVAVDSSSDDSVKRASVADEPIGIISTKPAVVANDKLGVSRAQHPKTDALVGLLGQLPVIVNDEAGPISIGDYIAVSGTPGQGRKAAPGDSVVGVALSGPDGESKVNVLLASGTGGLAPSGTTALQAGRAAGSVAPASSLALDSSQTFKDLTVLNEIAAKKITVLKGLTVQGSLKADSLVVDTGASFGGDVVLAGHITVGQDTAGRVAIKAGEKSARVDFTQDFDQTPLVQLTPHDFVPAYRVESVTTRGFVVSLSEAAQRDLNFDWLAIEPADK